MNRGTAAGGQHNAREGEKSVSAVCTVGNAIHAADRDGTTQSEDQSLHTAKPIQGRPSLFLALTLERKVASPSTISPARHAPDRHARCRSHLRTTIPFAPRTKSKSPIEWGIWLSVVRCPQIS